jgi:hypothetical protein
MSWNNDQNSCAVILQEASEDRRRSAGVDKVPIRQPRTDLPVDHFGVRPGANLLERRGMFRIANIAGPSATERTMRTYFFVMLFLATGVGRAEEWVTVPDPDPQPHWPGSAPIVSVDVQSIELLDAGIRRARVKIDFSSLPQEPKVPISKSLALAVSVTLNNFRARTTRDEAFEAHLADGTVTYTKSKNPEVWLQAARDPARDFVCAWKPK